MYVYLHNDTNSTTIYHFFFNFILATNKYQKRARERKRASCSSRKQLHMTKKKKKTQYGQSNRKMII